MSDSDGSDGYEWPEDTSVGKKLANLEENLLCPICSGLFNNPHVLRCGHSYCSICIIKHFDANLNRTSYDTCPSCREKADSFDLKKNSQLSSIVRAFRALRPEMLNLIKEETSKAKIKHKQSDYIGHSLGNSTGVAITRRLPHYNFHGVKKDKVKSILTQLTSESKVQIRLDGDKDVMEKRVRAFVHLSNSQVGSDTPLGLDEVVRRVNFEESQMEKETNRGLRSAGKIDKIRNGEVVKDVEDGFQGLAQKVREQKEAVLKKMSAAAVSSSSGKEQQDSPSSSASLPLVSEPGVGTKAGVSMGATESAQLVSFLERQVDRAYDWGPWRVVMSRRLGRPFFYNSVTKIGQFAVPPELNVVPSPTQSQTSQSQQEQVQGPSGGVESPALLQHHQNASQMAFDHYQASFAGHSNYSDPSRHFLHQQLHHAPDAEASASNYASAPSVRLDEGVVHYDHYLDDEEDSPFHMLWDSAHHELDELDSASFLLSDHALGSGAGSAGVGSVYRPGATPTATSAFSDGMEATAVSTVIDLPNSTPFPRGVAANSSNSMSSGVSGASTPWVVAVEEDFVASSAAAPSSSVQTSWACQACTYHNSMTTYTCDICNTVDVTVQQTFSKPLLRSHQHTPATSSGVAGRSQRLLSQATLSQSKGSGSKTKLPASSMKSSKKAKR